MPSHTSTGEWQSFEFRMRKRRVERLLLRAEVAAQAGCVDDATSALEEARKLAPGYPGITRLERELQERPPQLLAPELLAPDLLDDAAPLDETVPLDAPPVETQHRRWSVGWLLAVAAIVASAIGGALAVRSERTVRTPLPSRDVGLIVGEVVAPAPKPSAPPDSMPAADPVVSAPETRADVEPVAAPRAAAPAPIAPKPAPPVPPAPLPDVASAPEPHAADVVPAVTVSTAAPPLDSAPVNIPIPVSTTGSTTERPPATEPAPETLVRRALDGYAAAYNQLDAAAAQRVWPNVDRAALARAFDDLSSQHVALGNCDIAVAATTARANCSGSATWTPKIGGGGARTHARTWTFDLARAGAGWQIVSARVQNR